MAHSAAAAAAASTDVVMSDKSDKSEKKEVKGLEDDEKMEMKNNGPDLENNKDDPTRPVIELISKDKKTFEVSFVQALMSKLCKTALKGDAKSTLVELPSVAGSTLALIVQYMKHHNGLVPKIVEKPLRSKVLRDVVEDKWEAEFIDNVGTDRQNLYDLILAANYLEMHALLHLGCAKVASLIKGQPLEKIKDILDPKKKQDGASQQGSQQGAASQQGGAAAAASSSAASSSVKAAAAAMTD
jgi:S-phase kinase-associated protein 1